MAPRTKKPNPFEPPGSEGQAKTIFPTNARRILLRCLGGLLLLGSVLPARVAWFFLDQDYFHIGYRESYIYDCELTGIGKFTNNQLIGITSIITLLMWAAAIVCLRLSRRRNPALKQKTADANSLQIT